MTEKRIAKENLPRICLVAAAAVLITVTGILYRQSFIRILPLYISLFVAILQSRANRYANLLGGINSLLYMVVYLYLGLYASAGYALLFSCPVQLVTFIRWSRRKYGQSTQFRRLTGKQRILILSAFLFSFGILFAVLRAMGSDYQILDSLSSLLGITISLLTMFAYIEYTWLMLPSGILSIFLNAATMAAHPEQITYLIFSFYSMICVSLQFVRVKKLYAEQQKPAGDAAHG